MTAPRSWTPTPAPRPPLTTSWCCTVPPPADDGCTLDYDLTMGGGLWLNGGHLWHITWTQGTGSTFAFYDADGRPLRILSGRSYIAWLSSLTGEEVTVQDSAGNDLLQP